MQTISITPADGGWMVRCDGIDNPQVFRRGSSAEAAALRLAHGFAEVGEPARVKIHLRDGTLAKRLLIPPRPAALHAPPPQELAPA